VTRLLADFAAEVRADGATPVVLIFPGEGEIEAARDGRPAFYAPLLNTLEQRGIPVIDLTPVLGAAAREHPFAEVIQGHFRAVGNSAVARTLADRLPELTASTCGRLD
jgi:hypothetical protein